MKLTKAEKTFMLDLLRGWVDHPKQWGWVNPMDRDEVFTHRQMQELNRKLLNND